jgi:signal transduction histidine kinase
VSRETLINALEVAGAVYHRETRAQEQLLGSVRDDARREFSLGVSLILGLAFLTAAAAWLLPKRLLDPLAHLRSQFAVLGTGRFAEVSLDGVDAALVPLFQNYNALVRRRESLEEERRTRARTLEEEVRSGARVLLEQQRVLADAERLAVVGETAAGLAHELRNPLAGILAALENLKREVETPEIARRVGLLQQESERVVRRLNKYLSAGRHAPEAPVPTNLGGLVGDLLTLLRYQAPPGVVLEVEMEPSIRCVLPEGRVRQALLNLVGNSLQALEDSRGTVTVLGEVEGGSMTLEVRDDGPGFPEEILDLAGQPFQTGRASGTGLGLAMVRRLASDLGGSMTITNLVPRGASVVLTLPCKRAEGR